MAISQKDKRGYQMMAGAALVIAAMFALKLTLGTKPPPATDGCVGTPTSETVVVLDHSEELAKQTLDEITKRVMRRVEERVQTNERVTVFYVSELSKKSLVPAFSRCKPPQEGNRAYENAKGIAKVYKTSFLDPLGAAIKVAPANAKESPVAQALIDISLSQYLRGRQNTLLVYSDMLEHTPKFSLLHCTEPSKTIALFRQARSGAQERPKFERTSVVLNIVPRLNIPATTLKCRDQVWAWFFGDNEGQGAGLETDYLPGA
ncbi:MAG: hypothetical protein CFE46_00795 [Burkholderiales bacterium PBB6]|nr:MAG: hypothetical protein CFE46_00795 [Burkholderiales bacterium PBB6]